MRLVRALGGVAVGGVLLGACSLGGGSSSSSTSSTVNTAQTTFRTIPFTPTTTTTVAGAAPGATTTTVAGSTEGVYTVKAGDAWVSIARKLGVDAAALAEFNGKALTDPIHPGDQLKIPPKSTSTTAAGSSGGSTATTAAKAGSTTTTTSAIKVAGTYTVVAGDYWVGIARKLGVDYKSLLAVNGATASTRLDPGQKIKVPAKSAGATTTTAKAGAATTTTAKP
jgi:N-acetylmuramoyl-L-alanine amidase